jgi:hypothetical protein
VFSWIASLFTLKRGQLHPLLAIVVAVILVVSLLVLRALGHPELFLSFSFGLLVTGLSDIVVRGAYPTRVRWSGAIVLVGAVVTALGFLMGGASWVVVALAVLVTTLLSTLAMAYGKRGAIAGLLLNVWFIVALSASFALENTRTQTSSLAGSRALAWLVGGGLWLVVLGVAWGVRRRAQEQHSAPVTPPQETAAARVSRPLVTFAVLAAVAVGLATAVAWGFVIPNAVWMPVAAIVAMKPSLGASAYAGGQRIAGAILGGILAALLLTVVHNQTALAVVIVLVGAVGIALHEVNYALYYACISTAVLTALGLPHPGNLADNWERVAWTLTGVVIALAVIYVAGVVTNWESHRTATA